MSHPQLRSDVYLIVDDSLTKAMKTPSLVDLLGAPGESPTNSGKFILKAYAQKLVQGHRDKQDEERYKGTSLELVMRRIRSNKNVAEYWAQ